MLSSCQQCLFSALQYSKASTGLSRSSVSPHDLKELVLALGHIPPLRGRSTETTVLAALRDMVSHGLVVESMFKYVGHDVKEAWKAASA